MINAFGLPGELLPASIISVFEPGGGGGGGGAAAAGKPRACASAGGAGKLFPYTGLSYAGGGGGGTGASPSGGSGGAGGGGRGGGSSCSASTGSCSTGGGGGGGGGGCPNRPWGAAGGPGVVILVVPNAAYPGTTPGGACVSNPPAAPGLTVLTYLSSPGPSSNTSYTFKA